MEKVTLSCGVPRVSSCCAWVCVSPSQNGGSSPCIALVIVLLAVLVFIDHEHDELYFLSDFDADSAFGLLSFLLESFPESLLLSESDLDSDFELEADDFLA